MANQIEISNLYLQVASVTGDGMNLEMCNGTPDGKLSDYGPYPIAWFRADIKGQIKFVIETSSGIVSLPLSELERAIQAAKKEVHGEDYYEYPDGTA